ncbi:MAG TPA: MotA/TolQ/ExbB proton channel family protein [Acidobacteriota bacterium]|nr:MotA/TolQ/ExbB proton channel family protein [Acidobacteriota bacterium]
MDLATVVGLIAGIIVISLAVLDGDNPLIFVNLPSVLIVFGGTTATVLIRFPLERVLRTMQVIKHAFTFRLPSPWETIEEIVNLSRKSRKDGLLSLEDYETEDPFLARGLILVVDGAEAESVENVLLTDIRYFRQRHKQGQDILLAVAESGPAFGMIGTLIGLVIMLNNMSDVAKLGPAMAIAILTTLYGSVLANLFAIPLAKKLEVRSKEESLIRELILVGLVNIARGENPRMIETVLKAFLSENDIPSEPPAKPKEVKVA